MVSLTPLVVSFALVITAAFAAEHTLINVHAWPLGDATPQRLALLSYDGANASAAVVSWNGDNILSSGSSSALVRIGLLNPHWTGILTATAALGPDYRKALVLHADRQGAVYGIGFGAEPRVSRDKQAEGEDVVDVRVERARAGPVPFLNKPVVLDERGKLAGQEEPEKTFLQKYWWAIALFVLFQLFVGGRE